MTYNWSGKNLLIVEDNDMNRLLMKHVLEDTSINITFAQNSAMFFKLINANANVYDLILMDISLNEDINGIDLIDHMQINNINIPVIIQSAAFDDECFHNKCIDIIKKPINIDEALCKINNIFN